MTRLRSLARAILGLTLFCGWLGVNADEVHVAAAANFAPTLKQLSAAFESTQPHQVLASIGSTGKLYAQIAHGAPYDVFLAADSERPRRLVDTGLADAYSRFTYARGVLVLWSRDPQRVDSEGRVLREGGYARLAIANPRIAPYGNAAREALDHLGLWGDLQARIVRGENVAQAFQFVDSGSAEIGFVAKAQVTQLSAARRGSHWVVPPKLYAPIDQQAVLLSRARGHAAAKAFLEFLRGPIARALIEQSGYALP